VSRVFTPTARQQSQVDVSEVNEMNGMTPAQSFVNGPLSRAILRLRTQRGLSLSALAEQSGVAKGTLSNLERGVGNPTLETIFALSRGLGVPIGELVSSEEEAAPTFVARDDARHIRGVAVELMLYDRFASTGSATEIYDFRCLPGNRQISRGHPGVEHIVVKQGRLLTGPTSSPIEVSAGDYVSFPSWGEHAYEALDEVVEGFLVIHYPDQVGPSLALAVESLDSHGEQAKP
jgi:transcriptional regulator with XRE-family HTH domain